MQQDKIIRKENDLFFEEEAEGSPKGDFEILANAIDGPIAALNENLQKLLSDRIHIDMLEAGGGSWSKIAFDKAQDVTITTIDISSIQLENNTYATNKILGDICTFNLRPQSFDLIVCYDVLEHLADPAAAINSFVTATRLGGYVVLAAPRPLSLKGFITKSTPHFIHVLFYKIVLRYTHAGKAGYPPFPTTIKYYIEPSNLVRILKNAGFECVYLNVYDTGFIASLKSKNPILGTVLVSIVALVNAISGGRIRLDLSDFHLIARRFSE